MKQDFFVFLNTAKTKHGYYRQEVSLAIATLHFDRINILRNEISGIISNLQSSRDFFKGIGKQHEVELYVIYYTTLLARLNSA